MKSNIFSIVGMFILLSITVAFTSCKKEGCMDETAINYDSKAKKDDGSCHYEDHEAEVTFNITTPAQGASYDLGETVDIEATVSSTGEIHGYTVVIRNTSHGDEEVFRVEKDDHDNPLTIHEMWVNDVADHSDMELEISVYTDHDGSAKSTHAHFHCMPM